jgi:hypothetical protein
MTGLPAGEQLDGTRSGDDVVDAVHGLPSVERAAVDEEIGYQYLRGRYYDPSSGQFLTARSWLRDHARPLRIRRR